MFRTISIVGFLIVAAAIVVHFALFGRRRPDLSGDAATVCRHSVWGRLVLLGLVSSGIVLAVNGFVAVHFAADGRLTGYPLMLQCVAGAVFTVALAAAALTWADDCRFARCDLTWLARGGWLRPGRSIPAGRFDCIEKAAFWIVCLLGAAAAFTMFISMVPLASPEGLEVLFEVHRYCVLGLSMAAIVQMYRSGLAKPGLRRLLTGRVGPQWAGHYHSIWAGQAGRE